MAFQLALASVQCRRSKIAILVIAALDRNVLYFVLQKQVSKVSEDCSVEEFLLYDNSLEYSDVSTEDGSQGSIQHALG